MSALTNLFTSLANKIRSKVGGSQTYTPPQMVNAIDDVYNAGVAAGATPTQTKTVTAGTSTEYVYPDSGYALSRVTVYPTSTQSKSTTAGTSSKTVYPDSGYHLSSVTVSPTPTDSAVTVIPSSSSQTISPSSGHHLSSVTVDAIPSTYQECESVTPSDIDPPSLLANSGYVPTSRGWLMSKSYSIKAGTATLDTATAITVYLGFRPTYINYTVYNSSGVPKTMITYDYYYNDNDTQVMSGTSTYVKTENIVGNTNSARISSITNTGFVINKSASSGNVYVKYIATYGTT